MSELELLDLGDAKEETRQFIAIPVFFDNLFGLGLHPDL